MNGYSDNKYNRMSRRYAVLRCQGGMPVVCGWQGVYLIRWVVPTVVKVMASNPVIGKQLNNGLSVLNWIAGEGHILRSHEAGCKTTTMECINPIT